MNKNEFYYYDLPFWQDLTGFGEAMQYAFHSEPTSKSDKQKQQYWIDEIIKIVSSRVCEQIKAFKQENAEFLAESPVLSALLDTYLAAAETKEPEKLKAIYTAFQDLQKKIPFAENKEAYVDAGCSFTSNFNGNSGVNVLFPITLYGAYDPEGQRNDDHRGGYLWPVHCLNDEEIKELGESRPVLLKNLKNFKAAHERVMASQPGGPNN